MKNSAQLETGITASSTIGGGSNFAIGCKYALDKDAAVRAKVDTNSQVSQQIITLAWRAKNNFHSLTCDMCIEFRR